MATDVSTDTPTTMNASQLQYLLFEEQVRQGFTGYTLKNEFGVTHRYAYESLQQEADGTPVNVRAVIFALRALGYEVKEAYTVKAKQI